MRSTLGLALVLILVSTLALAPAAFAAPKNLEGSWRATSTIDGTPISNETLFTFSRGGTLIASSDNAGTSTGHGAWEKLTGSTFAATNVAFVYDASGAANQVFESEITFQVGADGNSFTATFETTVQTLDGTVLATVTGTATGSRIGG